MATLRRKSNLYLSKSQFIRGLQCHKSLFLHKYHPDLKDEISEELEAKFQSGKDVGIYAQKLFPNGVEIPFDDVTLSDQLQRTMKKIENRAETLYEAAFSYDNVFAKVDILHKGKEGWEIYEVKNSTKIKDVYLNDVAVQHYILKGAGLLISKAFLVHINNQYVRQGEIEVDKLFTIQDLTDTVVEKQGYVEDEIKKMRETLRSEQPDIGIGGHCSDPYDCDFWGHCWRHIPEDSIFNLMGNGPNKFDLYRQGIVHLKDVPKDILPRNQRIQLEGALEKKNITNKDAIKEFLDTLWYPLCFFDFETTYMVPIPMFDGTRPYQQVPFQYSLHHLENESAELKHYEYLAPANTDPRKELIEKLLDEIPENACVLAYKKSFETTILNYLKGWFPEYSDQIENIINNLRDSAIPFQRKDIYRWEMEGSHSLKDVLPVIVPELSYEEMEISDGAMASNAWLSTWELDDPEEIQKTRNALLEYCKLDTLGMVEILKKLREA